VCAGSKSSPHGSDSAALILLRTARRPARCLIMPFRRPATMGTVLSHVRNATAAIGTPDQCHGCACHKISRSSRMR
jgi:hypothetical protein